MAMAGRFFRVQRWSRWLVWGKGGRLLGLFVAVQTNSLISFDFAVDDHLPADSYICYFFLFCVAVSAQLECPQPAKTDDIYIFCYTKFRFGQFYNCCGGRKYLLLLNQLKISN